MKQAAQAKQGIREESLTPTVTDATSNVASSSPTSVGATSGNTFGGGATGSSINNSTTMNPNAAASLYAGNTNAALANQFGTPNRTYKSNAKNGNRRDYFFSIMNKSVKNKLNKVSKELTKASNMHKKQSKTVKK